MTQRDMKILVMGGTGAMGSHLVAEGRRRGSEIYVTSRNRSGTEDGVRYIRGNAMDDEFLAGLLATRWDAIVDFMVYPTSGFKRRLGQLLDATRQYFFLSSARVYGDSPVAITEDTPRLLDSSKDEVFLATDEYALAKARQEDLLFDSGRENWTIIRPYITYARERLQLGVLEKEAWLYRALRGRSIVFPRDILDRLTTMTHGRDVAHGILSLIDERGALGKAFHITGPRSDSWRKIMAIYLDALEQHLGRKPRVHLTDMEEFLRCHDGEFQVRYDRAFDRSFDTARINDYLRVDEFTDCVEGLHSCITEFLKQPVFKRIDWSLEAQKDRLTGEHTPLGEILGKRAKLRYLLLRYFRLDFQI